MNEAETRAEHIDPALRAAGWGVVDGSRVLREKQITLGRIEGHGKRGKPLIADYVLVYRNLKLGVVEAKALDKPFTEASVKPRITRSGLPFGSPTRPTVARSTALTCRRARKGRSRNTLRPKSFGR